MKTVYDLVHGAQNCRVECLLSLLRLIPIQVPPAIDDAGSAVELCSPDTEQGQG